MIKYIVVGASCGIILGLMYLVSISYRVAVDAKEFESGACYAMLFQELSNEVTLIGSGESKFNSGEYGTLLNGMSFTYDAPCQELLLQYKYAVAQK